MTNKTKPPCPTCMKAHEEGHIRTEAIQPLPDRGIAPIGLDGNPQCYDCASAGTLVRLKTNMGWGMARAAVGQDRQEQYRLPGAPMGLVYSRVMRPSEEGDHEKHIEWLEEVGLYDDEY